MLDTEFAQRLLLVFKMMREQHGYEMTILEGYRSPGRQDVLSKLGPNVTNAKAWQSYHQ
jgi:peptidoglycan L-alanyl-D-glutamate endopeptidase CwlK